jgi:hypothetical protein
MIIFNASCKRLLLLSSILLGSILLSACLETPAEETLPPYEEEVSEDGGMYRPQQPSTTSGYGSGASQGSGVQNKQQSRNLDVNCQEQIDQDQDCE